MLAFSGTLVNSFVFFLLSGMLMVNFLSRMSIQNYFIVYALRHTGLFINLHHDFIYIPYFVTISYTLLISVAVSITTLKSNLITSLTSLFHK